MTETAITCAGGPSAGQRVAAGCYLSAGTFLVTCGAFDDAPFGGLGTTAVGALCIAAGFTIYYTTRRWLRWTLAPGVFLAAALAPLLVIGPWLYGKAWFSMIPEPEGLRERFLAAAATAGPGTGIDMAMLWDGPWDRLVVCGGYLDEQWANRALRVDVFPQDAFTTHENEFVLVFLNGDEPVGKLCSAGWWTGSVESTVLDRSSALVQVAPPVPVLDDD